ncbi:MAG: TonB-dependent receptor [Bacteroidetes bacterium]|nr:TonB-dependent receptor [Bacteroidota bacterium]
MTPTYSFPKTTKNHTNTIQKDTIHFNDVTIQGKYTPSKIIPVQTLEGVDLERLSVVSVADAVRYFSGVQIKDYGGIGGLKTVNIRSMGTNHVGVFYDGIQLGNAQNGQIDLGRFSLDNMEAVSLYNGQKSAVLQPAKDYASAGSIYMKTKTPTFKDNKTNNYKATLKGGSFETINPSLTWEHKFKSNIKTAINAEYLYTSGKYKFTYAKKNGYDTTEVRKNGDLEAIRAEAGIFGQLKNGEWKAKAYFYNSERGYPGASVREEPGKYKHEDRQWDRNFFVQSSLRNSFGKNYTMLLNAKYSNDYLHYVSDPRLDVTTMYVNNTYLQQECYFSVANEFNFFEWWNANLAVDYQWNTLDADLIDFAYPQRNTILSAFATSFRFEKVKVQGSVLHTFVHDNTKAVGGAAENKSIFTPTLVASYSPFNEIDLDFRAFYKRIFRMPTLNDLYYTFIGNKYLDPEYTNQYNLGFTYIKDFENVWLKKIDIQIDGYFNQIDDKIIAMPTSNQFQWTMINLGYVEIRGIDVALQFSWKIGEVGLGTRVNYTYQKAQDFTNPEDEWYGGQIPYIPWHSASSVINVQYKNWDMNYSFIYTGERYESRANIIENYAQPWYTHDLSLSKKFEWEKADLKITAEINNIFDQQYEVVQCYPMPGTNFKLRATVTL